MGFARHPGLMERETARSNRRGKRSAAQSWAAFRDASPLPGSATRRHRPRLNVILEGHVRQNMFPAKYVFDPGAPRDCTNGLCRLRAECRRQRLERQEALPILSLSTPLCQQRWHGLLVLALTAPTVCLAYNITTVSGGRILTSPVLSLDGTQTHLRESVSGNPGCFYLSRLDLDCLARRD